MAPTPKPARWWVVEQQQRLMARELEQLGDVAPLRRAQQEARLASYDQVAAQQAATVAAAGQEAAQQAQQAHQRVEAERVRTPAELAQQLEADKDAAVRAAFAAAQVEGRALPTAEEIAAIQRTVIARYLPQRGPAPAASPTVEDETASARDELAGWVRRAF